MPSELAQIESWLIEEWISRLASAIESRAGERPQVSSSALPGPPEGIHADQSSPAWLWRQPLPPLAGAVWVVALPGNAEACGAHILRALGVEDTSAAEQKSTFQESINQALGGLAQALTARLKREVNHAGG